VCVCVCVCVCVFTECRHKVLETSLVGATRGIVAFLRGNHDEPSLRDAVVGEPRVQGLERDGVADVPRGHECAQLGPLSGLGPDEEKAAFDTQ
jgi:hypothetical protein